VIAEQRLRGRRLLQVTAVVLAEKSLLDLQGDLMEPPLGAIRPLLMVPDVGLELADPFLGGTKLGRQLVCHLERLLVVCLGSGSRPVHQPQNGLRGPIQRIASFRFGFRLWRKRNNCFGCACSAAAHRTPLHPYGLNVPISALPRF
jgi:hypothetical protein